MAQDTRASWPKYFMDIAYLVAQRSTCLRRKVGAVAVLDKRILATGYNGAPSGVPHCFEAGCLRQQLGIPSGQRHEICRGIHAEQNVIIQAAVHGISLRGAEIFCTTQPCLICAKMLINCGVKKIWIAEGYPDQLSEGMLAEAGVEVIVLSREEGGCGESVMNVKDSSKVRFIELLKPGNMTCTSCSCGCASSAPEGGRE